MEKKYLVEESYLTSIADIIRNKTGLTNKLTFPDEFFEEIRNIETSPATALPVLDMNYPEDVTVIEGANVSVNFNVVIAQPGVPAVYTYQWYFNGEAVEGANSSGFSINQEITKGTYNVYCKVTNDAGVVTSRIGSLVVENYLPEFDYNGTYNLIEEGNYNWRIKFLTSGTLKFTKLKTTIDAFAVGGGGSGGARWGGGGGGGYTKTLSSLTFQEDVEYTVTVGAGGAVKHSTTEAGNTGGTSSIAKGSTNVISASGGKGGKPQSSDGGAGGSGGGGGGTYGKAGGSDGSDGTSYSNGGAGGAGQGKTTREFGESSGTLYAGGGGGGSSTDHGRGAGGSGGGGHGGGISNSELKLPTKGSTNTGGGGGGGLPYVADLTSGTGEAGGSGIVVIRNHRS